MLLPTLADPTEDEALPAGGRSLSYRELKASASALAARVGSAERVAVWASPTLETCVAVVGVLLSGAAVVPINPKTGPRELEHVLRDSGPGLLVASNEEDLPDAPGSLPRIAVDLEAREASLPHEPGGEAPAV